MKCEDIDPLIVRRGECALTVDEAAMLEAHLAMCAACRDADALSNRRGAAERAQLPRVDGNTYEKRSKLGRGGMGVTWLAWDRRLRRLVALKQPRPDKITGELLAQFEDEARLTARLQHPAIVSVYEAGYMREDDGEQLFYAMEHVAGDTLADEIAQRITLDERLALLSHLTTIAQAVAYAHQHGIVHRDIKPENILIGQFGEAVLIDWGLAKYVDEEATALDLSSDKRTWTVRGAGTPLYMAPEQALGAPAAPPADVYALGATLFHVLAGEAAYQGVGALELKQRLHANQPPPRVDEIEPRVPRELATIVAKAMEPQIARRFTTAKELADELTRFANGQLVQSHHHTWFDLALRWLRRHRLAVALASAMVVLLTVLVLLVAARQEVATIEGEVIGLRVRSSLDDDVSQAIRLGGRHGRSAEVAAMRAIATRYGAKGNIAVTKKGFADLAMAELGRVLRQQRPSATIVDPSSRRIGFIDPLEVYEIASGRRTLGDTAIEGVASAAFSGDGETLLALICDPGSLLAWRVADGNRLPDKQIDLGKLDPDKQIERCGESIAVSAHGRLVAVKRSRGIALFDVRDSTSTRLTRIGDLEIADIQDVLFARDGDIALLRLAKEVAIVVVPEIDAIRVSRRRPMEFAFSSLSPQGGFFAIPIKNKDKDVFELWRTSDFAHQTFEGVLLELGDREAFARHDGLERITLSDFKADKVKGPAGAVFLARSRDGTQAATIDERFTTIWSTTDHESWRPLVEMPASVFAPRGHFLSFVSARSVASIGASEARVIDMPDSLPSHWLGTPLLTSKNGRILVSEADSPLGQDEATKDEAGAMLTLIELATDPPHQIGTVVLPSVHAERNLMFSASGNVFAIGAARGTDVVRVDGGAHVRIDSLVVASISPGGTWMLGGIGDIDGIAAASWGMYETARLFDAGHRDKVVSEMPSRAIPGFSLSHRGNFKFSDDDRWFGFLEGSKLTVIDLEAPAAPPLVRERVERFGFTPGGIATASSDGKILVATGPHEVTMHARIDGAVTGFAGTRRDGGVLAVATSRALSNDVDASIELFDLTTGRSRAELSIGERIDDLIFTAGGWLVVKAGKLFRIFDVDGSLLRTLTADALADDLSFAVTLTPGLATRWPISWPDANALLEIVARRTNARVCEQLDRVVFMLPYPATDSDTPFAPQERCR